MQQSLLRETDVWFVVYYQLRVLKTAHTNTYQHIKELDMLGIKHTSLI